MSRGNMLNFLDSARAYIDTALQRPGSTSSRSVNLRRFLQRNILKRLSSCRPAHPGPIRQCRRRKTNSSMPPTTSSKGTVTSVTCLVSSELPALSSEVASAEMSSSDMPKSSGKPVGNKVCGLVPENGPLYSDHTLKPATYVPVTSADDVNQGAVTSSPKLLFTEHDSYMLNTYGPQTEFNGDNASALAQHWAADFPASIEACQPCPVALFQILNDGVPVVNETAPEVHGAQAQHRGPDQLNAQRDLVLTLGYSQPSCGQVVPGPPSGQVVCQDEGAASGGAQETNNSCYYGPAAGPLSLDPGLSVSFLSPHRDVDSQMDLRLELDSPLYEPPRTTELNDFLDLSTSTMPNGSVDYYAADVTHSMIYSSNPGGSMAEGFAASLEGSLLEDCNSPFTHESTSFANAVLGRSVQQANMSVSESTDTEGFMRLISSQRNSPSKSEQTEISSQISGICEAVISREKDEDEYLQKLFSALEDMVPLEPAKQDLSHYETLPKHPHESVITSVIQNQYNLFAVHESEANSSPAADAAPASGQPASLLPTIPPETLPLARSPARLPLTHSQTFPLTHLQTTLPLTQSPAILAFAHSPATFPFSRSPAILPLSLSPAALPPTHSPATLPLTQSPATFPLTLSSATLPLTQSPAILPLTLSPATLPLTQSPATFNLTHSPATLPLTYSPATLPLTHSQTTLPLTQSPATLPLIQSPATLPLTHSQTTLTLTQSPATEPLIQSPTIVPLTQSPATVPLTQSPVRAPCTHSPGILPCTRSQARFVAIPHELILSSTQPHPPTSPTPHPVMLPSTQTQVMAQGEESSTCGTLQKTADVLLTSAGTGTSVLDDVLEESEETVVGILESDGNCTGFSKGLFRTEDVCNMSTTSTENIADYNKDVFNMPMTANVGGWDSDICNTPTTTNITLWEKDVCNMLTITNVAGWDKDVCNMPLTSNIAGWDKSVCSMPTTSNGADWDKDVCNMPTTANIAVWDNGVCNMPTTSNGADWNKDVCIMPTTSNGADWNKDVCNTPATSNGTDWDNGVCNMPTTSNGADWDNGVCNMPTTSNGTDWDNGVCNMPTTSNGTDWDNGVCNMPTTSNGADWNKDVCNMSTTSNGAYWNKDVCNMPSTSNVAGWDTSVCSMPKTSNGSDWDNGVCNMPSTSNGADWNNGVCNMPTTSNGSDWDNGVCNMPTTSNGADWNKDVCNIPTTTSVAGWGNGVCNMPTTANTAGCDNAVHREYVQATTCSALVDFIPIDAGFQNDFYRRDPTTIPTRTSITPDPMLMSTKSIHDSVGSTCSFKSREVILDAWRGQLSGDTNRASLTEADSNLNNRYRNDPAENCLQLHSGPTVPKDQEQLGTDTGAVYLHSLTDTIAAKPHPNDPQDYKHVSSDDDGVMTYGGACFDDDDDDDDGFDDGSELESDENMDDKREKGAKKVSYDIPDESPSQYKLPPFHTVFLSEVNRRKSILLQQH